MNVCIDFDDTITKDPEAWLAIIDFLQKRGHTIFCITLRYPNVPLPKLPIEVYYACGQPKWEFAFEKGLHVDIWIDDWPMVIGEHPERKGLKPPQMMMREAEQRAQ